jgi:hypothetical protein
MKKYNQIKKNNKTKTIIALFVLLGICSASTFSLAQESNEFADKVISEHGIVGSNAIRLKKILTNTHGLTRNIGTEDLNEIHGPRFSWHPTSRAKCIDKVIKTGLIKPNAEYEKICGAKWMAPVLDFPGQHIDQAQVCIDQFEFPDIPCEYPIVWTPAATAKQICESMGKRVCNSHEWEGSCAGAMDNKDPYLFKYASLQDRKNIYNKNREIVWAFQWDPSLTQVTDTREVCGVYSPNDQELSSPMKENPSKYYSSLGKSTQCKPDYQTCGTNTWPAGFKYKCRTELGVYDLHGNVAEVMSFPTSPAGIAHGTVTDHTERKGSFFVYRKGIGYPDDCRVRQPYEHFGEYAKDKMAFYQEGFRCCKDVK